MDVDILSSHSRCPPLSFFYSWSPQTLICLLVSLPSFGVDLELRYMVSPFGLGDDASIPEHWLFLILCYILLCYGIDVLFWVHSC